VPHDVIGHVALYEQLVNAVGSDGSVEGVVDGTITHIGTIHLSRQVEVDRIAT